MHACVAHAQRSHVAKLYAHCHVLNIHAQEFFRAQAFKQARSVPDYYRALKPSTAVEMERALPTPETAPSAGTKRSRAAMEAATCASPRAPS